MRITVLRSEMVDAGSTSPPTSDTSDHSVSVGGGGGGGQHAPTKVTALDSGLLGTAVEHDNTCVNVTIARLS